MASYTQVVSSRTAEPDHAALRSAVQVALGNDATAAVVPELEAPFTYRIKRTSDAAFTQPEKAALKTAIDACPIMTPQRAAQNEIDVMPIAWKAIALALLDQLNVIRAALPTPLGAITPAQALAAIRTKAGQL